MNAKSAIEFLSPVPATSLYCPKLIGRDVELGAMLRLAAKSVAGEATGVLVSGDAGIGKTRLLDEFRAWAKRRAIVASVTCPSFAPAPLGPIYAALAHVDGGASAAAPKDRDFFGQLQLFGRICERLRAVSISQPVVVIIDDAHWADTATLEFLAFAARELSDSRVMLVIAFRREGTERTANLERVVVRLARLGNVHQISLTPLPHVAIAEILEATLGEAALSDRRTLVEVARRAEGNPLFAEELLKAAVDNEGGGAPGSLRSLVSERASEMSATERRLLELAALIGRRFDVSFLETVAGGVPRPEILAFLRAAVRRHLLIEERENVGWFAFRHALVRDAVLEDILAIESRELHLSIARALQCEPDASERAAELSDHFWHAGAKNECAAVARVAGDRALERFAYREAADQYERFIQCGTHDGDGRLHSNAGVAYRALGIEKAVEHFALAADLAERDGDRELAILALLEMAGFKFRVSDQDGAFAVLDRAAAIERGRPDARLRVAVLAQRALLLAVAGDFVRLQPILAELEPLLMHASATDKFRFLMARGNLRFFHERNFAGCLRDAEAAAEVARRSGDLRMTIVGNQTIALHSARFQAAPDVLARFDAALTTAENHGNLLEASVTRAHRANARIQAGRLEEALSDLRVLLAEPHENPLWRIYRAVVAARLAVYLRDDSLLVRAGAHAAFERLADQNIGVWCRLAGALAEAYAARGDLEAARALTARLACDADFPDDESNACRSLPVIAALGTREHVEAARTKTALWRFTSNPIVGAQLALFDAYAQTRFGSSGTAQSSAQAAVAAYAALQMPLLEAEASVLAGLRERAAAIAKACGARRLPAVAASVPANALRGKRLSRREEEIATLAAAGRSNAAIADELVLSVRTVEAHLASAFTKLGVDSRTALGTALDDPLRPSP